MHKLSKSTYLRGMQCIKSLYFNKFHPELKDEIGDAQQAIFDKGHLIGEYAWKLFPGGRDASEGEPFEVEKSLQRTQELIEEGQEVIYEAAFEFEGVLCYMDILLKDGAGWKAYEVKGSTNIKNYHIDDTALQYYVITHSGIDLKDISVVCLNNRYVRQGEIEAEKLFKIESVLEKIGKKQKEVAENIQRFKDVLSSGSVPDMDIGPYCSDPYACDFRGHCWKHIPENTVFDINKLAGKKKFELYRQGILTFEDINREKVPLNPNQHMQVDASLKGTITKNKTALLEFLNKLNYPLYFLDFETFQPAVPLYDQSRPYQQIPFQYSLHVQMAPGAEVRHYEFLADGDADPRIPFIQQLIKDLKEEGDIVVYNQAFENGRLKEIARDFPEFAEEIKKISPRIVDLMKPFRSKHYYLPQMQGSYSIKKVLPALVPGLNYDELEISEGGAASRGFEGLMYAKDPVEKEKLRNNLLEYCKLDTLAMVRILEILTMI